MATTAAGIDVATVAAEDLAAAVSVVKVSEGTLKDLEAMGGSTEEVTKAQVALKEAMEDLALKEQAIADAESLEIATREIQDSARDGIEMFERLGTAIRDIPTNVDVDINATVHRRGDGFWNGGDGGYQENQDVPMAEGGLVTGPTRILAGEAGPEMIIPLDRLGEFSRDDSATLEEMRAINRNLERLMATQPSATARAVRDALRGAAVTR